MKCIYSNKEPDSSGHKHIHLLHKSDAKQVEWVLLGVGGTVKALNSIDCNNVR